MASTSLQFGPDQLKCKEYYSYVTGARKGDDMRISPCPFSVAELMFFVSTSVTCIRMYSEYVKRSQMAMDSY
jgi:hypothetical protein